MNYSMTVDYARNRVEIMMYAYEVDTSKFFSEFQRSVSQAKGGGKHFDVCVDFTQMKFASPVMPRNVADESAEMNSWSEAHGMRKSASIMTSALFKLQLQRMTTVRHYANFHNREDAEAWLQEE